MKQQPQINLFITYEQLDQQNEPTKKKRLTREIEINYNQDKASWTNLKNLESFCKVSVLSKKLGLGFINP